MLEILDIVCPHCFISAGWLLWDLNHMSLEFQNWPFQSAVLYHSVLITDNMLCKLGVVTVPLFIIDVVIHVE